MDKFSFLGASHINMIEEMYQQYLSNNPELDKEWKHFFQGFDFAQESYDIDIKGNDVPKEFKVITLIDAYRSRGHLFTLTNPVRERRKHKPSLDISNFGLDKSDMDAVFQAGNEIGIGPSKLSDIINHLNIVYCQSIGVEFMYMRDPERLKWMINKLHENSNTPNFSATQKKHLLHKVTQAVAFEGFLHKKFVGQKRFSLEGAESLIPALDTLIEHSASLGVEEFVMGMAHRGRLNVLANIFNKTYKEIFSEFEGKLYEDDLIAGDVKYHLGFTSTQKCTNGNNVKLTLSPNPSHLEAVDPVVEGITRAKIDTQYNGDHNKIVPILIHGDAAIAGQGVVYEVIQMAQLKGYQNGGTIHIVINNQVGFTTNYLDARSSTYCTDIAKVTLCPVFHVNGDDIEAVAHTLKIASEYRQKFNRDVFIDLLCYRKYGHNEGDEPRFTQPKLYDIISKHPNPREIYKAKLIDENVLDSSEIDAADIEFKSLLETRFDESQEIKKAKITPFLEDEWNGVKRSTKIDFYNTDTTFNKSKLIDLSKVLYTVKEKSLLFKKTQKLLDNRKKMIENDQLDWSMGELLAYATLIQEGFPIRISGQDSERGTFSHRHAIIKEEKSENEISLLNQIDSNTDFNIFNSLLSEYGVLGFDYGYSITTPNTLTIWEAQFGDFSNGAQIMIDQFISCAEDKWKVQSGLVMLLPHGYEGQGAEHSSARLERYLQLCAQYNMQIVNCTTPANFFHVLRRQLKRSYRKPLIVMTPKSLLRHPKCISSLDEFSTGTFMDTIDDSNINSNDVKRIVLCSGKIYYEIDQKRKELKNKNVAIIRVEQLFPLNTEFIDKLYKKYNKSEMYWVQEEPENMGAWSFVLPKLRDYNIQLISRDESAATASGSTKDSQQKQQVIIDSVFNNIK